MIISPDKAKNICKNGANKRYPNDTSFVSMKDPMKSMFFEHFARADSDKESSHVVGKFSHSGA